jgi:hypothetical protein
VPTRLPRPATSPPTPARDIGLGLNQPIRIAGCGASLPPPGGRPCRAGSTEPVRATRAASFTAKLALTLNRSAALRRDCPLSISPWDALPKLDRMCFPHACWPLIPASILNQISVSLGIPIRFPFPARRSSSYDDAPTRSRTEERGSAAGAIDRWFALPRAYASGHNSRGRAGRLRAQ